MKSLGQTLCGANRLTLSNDSHRRFRSLALTYKSVKQVMFLTHALHVLEARLQRPVLLPPARLLLVVPVGLGREDVTQQSYRLLAFLRTEVALLFAELAQNDFHVSSLLIVQIVVLLIAETTTVCLELRMPCSSHSWFFFKTGFANLMHYSAG